jgi:NAD(P)-dependent dehydrogenase (short-subunit alcohol dehydrogenase family)
MQGRLKGKVILVAGAGGIGDELARRYASEGASVLLGDINGAAAKAVAEQIVHAGHTAAGIELNGADDGSIMSDEGSFITGQAIGVDGGTSMRP